MLTIPINGSLIYVEPIYLKSSNESSLPQVARVVVAYGEKIAYENTLKDALASLFGTAATSTTGPAVGENTTTIDINTLAQLADAAYNNAIAAQKNGDWASYGNYLKELHDYLQRMQPTAP